MRNDRSFLWESAPWCLVVGLLLQVAALADNPTPVFVDDFENGNVHGWTFIKVPDDSEVRGLWEIGDPNGTVFNDQPAQPEDAYAGIGCAFTEQNSSTGAHDVDRGVVWMTSPAIDLSGAVSADLSYARWYYNGRPEDMDLQDYFTVEVRPGPSADWVTVEYLGYADTANVWTPRSASLGDLIPLTATVQLRFGASDGRVIGSILEAAVDEVVVSAHFGCSADTDCGESEYCGPDGACAPYGNGDFDLDGDVDLSDLAMLQSCFAVPAAGACAAGNMTGDMVIDLADLAACLDRLNGPGGVADR